MTSVAPQPGEETTEASRTVTFRSREFVAGALLVTCLPFLLLLPNQDWFFTSETYIDPWHYVGFFHEYLNPDYSPGAYKLARLPWILAGFAANRVFDPIPAAFALHAVFLGLTPLALFLALYVQLGRVAMAGAVATAFGFHTHAHGSGSWDYHNTAAGALYLLALTMTVLPTVAAGRRVGLILTGAMTALAVHTNITLVNFLPVLAFMHVRQVQLQADRWPSVRRLAVHASWMLLGAVLVTIALGTINWLAGREFWFFAVLTSIVVQYVADPQQYQGGYHQAWSTGWVLTARYLALPAAVFVAGIAALLLRRRRAPHGRTDAASALIGAYLLTVLVWVGWQMVGQTALDWNYFAYPLIPACFLALGGLLSFGWPSICERHWLVTVLSTGVLSFAALVGVPHLTRLDVAVAPVIAVVGATVFGAGLLAYVSRPGVATAITALAVLAAGNRLVAYQPLDYAASDRCKVQAPIYRAIVDAASWLATLDPTHKRIRIWFDQDEQIGLGTDCKVGVGSMGYAITAMTAVEYVTPAWPMPGVGAVPDAALHALGNDHGILAIVTNEADNLDDWNRRLISLGMDHRELPQDESRAAAPLVPIRAWEIIPRPVESGQERSFGSPVVNISRRTPPKINLYGSPKGNVAGSADRVVVTPTDPRDHVEYGLLELPASAGELWARVTIEVPDGNADSCRVEIKDPGFALLATLACRSATSDVSLPLGLAAIRVYVSDLNSRPFRLPTKIEIALAESPK